MTAINYICTSDRLTSRTILCVRQKTQASEMRMTTAIYIEPPKDGVVDTCMAFLPSMAGRHFNADLRRDQNENPPSYGPRCPSNYQTRPRRPTHRTQKALTYHRKWQTPGDKLVAVGSSVRNIY